MINIILAVLIGIFILLGIVGFVLYLIIKNTAEATCEAVEKATGEIISGCMKGVINEVIKK